MENDEKKLQSAKNILIRLLTQFDELSIEEITKQLIELLVYIKTPNNIVSLLYSKGNVNDNLREALQMAIDSFDLDLTTNDNTRSVTKQHYKKHARHFHL